MTPESRDLDTPIWGAEAFAETLNVNTRKVYHLLHTGQLDATKIGESWVSTPRRLLRKILSGEAA